MRRIGTNSPKSESPPAGEHLAAATPREAAAEQTVRNRRSDRQRTGRHIEIRTHAIPRVSVDLRREVRCAAQTGPGYEIGEPAQILELRFQAPGENGRSRATGIERFEGRRGQAQGLDLADPVGAPCAA